MARRLGLNVETVEHLRASPAYQLVKCIQEEADGPSEGEPHHEEEGEEAERRRQ